MASEDDEWERRRTTEALDRELDEDRAWFERRRTTPRPSEAQIKLSEAGALIFQGLGWVMLVCGFTIVPLGVGAFEVWGWLQHARWPNYQLVDYFPVIPTIDGLAGANQLLVWVWQLWLGLPASASFIAAGLLFFLVATVLDEDIRGG